MPDPLPEENIDIVTKKKKKTGFHSLMNTMLASMNEMLKTADAEFESKHPRADDGKFGEGGGSSQSGSDKNQKRIDKIKSMLKSMDEGKTVKTSRYNRLKKQMEELQGDTKPEEKAETKPKAEKKPKETGSKLNEYELALMNKLEESHSISEYDVDDFMTEKFGDDWKNKSHGQRQRERKGLIQKLIDDGMIEKSRGMRPSGFMEDRYRIGDKKPDRSKIPKKLNKGEMSAHTFIAGLQSALERDGFKNLDKAIGGLQPQGMYDSTTWNMKETKDGKGYRLHVTVDAKEAGVRFRTYGEQRGEEEYEEMHDPINADSIHGKLTDSIEKTGLKVKSVSTGGHQKYWDHGVSYEIVIKKPKALTLHKSRFASLNSKLNTLKINNMKLQVSNGHSGRWVTMNGNHVFIRTNETIESALARDIKAGEEHGTRKEKQAEKKGGRPHPKAKDVPEGGMGSKARSDKPKKEKPETNTNGLNMKNPKSEDHHPYAENAIESFHSREQAIKAGGSKPVIDEETGLWYKNNAQWQNAHGGNHVDIKTFASEEDVMKDLKRRGITSKDFKTNPGFRPVMDEETGLWFTSNTSWQTAHGGANEKAFGDKFLHIMKPVKKATPKPKSKVERYNSVTPEGGWKSDLFKKSTAKLDTKMNTLKIASMKLASKK
jgi:hypothetical protein